MDIPEMHIYFRQYAQQMGMQNYRAILPEQIDTLINSSITDIVNQLIRENLASRNDRVATDNNKIGFINALKPLYKDVEIPAGGSASATKSVKYMLPAGNTTTHPYYIIAANSSVDTSGSYTPIAESVVEKNSNGVYRIDVTEANALNVLLNKYCEEYGVDAEHIEQTVFVTTSYIKNPSETADGQIRGEFSVKSSFAFAMGMFKPAVEADALNNIEAEDAEALFGSNVTLVNTFVSGFNFDELSPQSGKLTGYDIVDNAMYLVDFSVNYKRGAKGYEYTQPEPGGIVYDDDTNKFVSNYFPVRWIDATYLSDTLNDYVLSPRLRAPIVVVSDDKYDFYFGNFIYEGEEKGYMLTNNLLPYKVKINYIAKPDEVAYSEDIGGQNVNCNLPDYLHIDIVKHAVDLYRIAVSGGLHVAQQQDNAQQQELARNNVRPTNDGYSE